MKTIKIYTTSYCPYCQSAKQLLNKLKLSFEEVSLEGKDDLRAKISQENGGYRTVPMIFIGDQFIGGFTDLAAMHKSGELERLL